MEKRGFSTEDWHLWFKYISSISRLTRAAYIHCEKLIPIANKLMEKKACEHSHINSQFADINNLLRLVSTKATAGRWFHTKSRFIADRSAMHRRYYFHERRSSENCFHRNDLRPTILGDWTDDLLLTLMVYWIPFQRLFWGTSCVRRFRVLKNIR